MSKPKYARIIRFARKYFFILMTILFYALVVYSLFVLQSIFQSLILLIVLLFVLPYFFIEIKDFGYLYFALLVVGALILKLILIEYTSMYQLIGMYFFDFALLIYGHVKFSEITNRKKLSNIGIFMKGSTLFTTSLALSYSFMFVGIYDTFNLNCGDIYGALDRGIQKVGLIASNFGFDSAVNEQDLQNSLEDISSKQIGDFLLSSEYISLLQKQQLLTGKVGDINDEALEDVDVNLDDLSDDEINYIIDSYEQNKTPFNIENPFEGSLLGGVMTPIYEFSNKIATDKYNMNKAVCSFLVDNISENYNDSGFKGYVIMFLSVLFWPFFKIIFLIMGLFNSIIFSIMKLIKLYRVGLFTQEVEDIL